MAHIIIIGNGIAGVTAARHIRKMSDHRITIISKESKYFFSRTALMYVYMGHMKFEHTQPYENNFWVKNKIELLQDYVHKIDPATKTLALEKNKFLQYDKLIIATGSVSNYFGWPGQDAQGVLGLYSKQDLEQLESLSPTAKHAVIVGGGLIGIELAEMLHTRNIGVTMLIREKTFWNGVLPREESEMIGRHIKDHGINAIYEDELDEIITNDKNVATGVKTKNGKNIECEIVGLTAGVSPNIKWLKESEIETKKGVLVNEFLETSATDVYAIGDCAEQRKAIGERKTVEAVWYTGRMMGETVALTICGERAAYAPGPWFNSAKFLDIEYMTYGWVWAEVKKDEKQIYWEHADGNKAIRFAYNKDSGVFTGVNVFGIRLKHDFFDKALRETWTIQEVFAKLPTANFDPEFYKKFEKEILSSLASV